ncbi:MAG: serine/threonine-protein phosphatase [Calditrichaeota bacterium]|nr:serine/threonine-protein phosphatase [Calditrichota bacterium]
MGRTLLAQEIQWRGTGSLGGSDAENYEAGGGEAEGDVLWLCSDTARTGKYVNFYRRLDPAPFKPARLLLEAQLRTKAVSGYACLMVRVEGPESEIYGFDNMADRRLAGDTDWTTVRLVVDVPDGSQSVFVGLMMSGSGRVEARRMMFEEVMVEHQITGYSPAGMAIGGPRRDLLDRERVKLERLRSTWLPRIDLRAGSVEISGSCQPCGELGGDYYCCEGLVDGRILIFLGDVAGHDMSASLVSALSRGAVLAWSASREPDVDVLFSTLNRIVREFPGKPRLLTATCLVLLDPANGSWSCWRNGVPKPLHVDSAGDVRPLNLTTRLPIGAMAGPRLTRQDGVLLPGEFLLLHSDGLTETRDADDEILGDERLREIARADLDVTDLSAFIFDRVARFAGNREATDDRTLIVVKRCADR